MAFTKRWKAELGISLLIFIEFLGITLWALLTDRNDIFFSCAILMGIGLIFTLVKIYEAKFQSRRVDDERIEMLTEQAYLISAIAGMIMLPQIAIYEIFTGITVSALDTFVIVANTCVIVFLVVELFQQYWLS
ncbi:MAG: hypothetical protein JSW11_02370 [Candidatus Heimdallarchaeota archaeon]|nr:MAG: hypothetical protein JSW11_02370 [Candidatus Heimdallarchaeota archaeon]